MKMFLSTFATFLTSLLLANCATESHKAIETKEVATHKPAFNGKKLPLTVGQFDNRSSSGQSIFANGENRLGSQAKTILITHLQTSSYFEVLDRTNMSESAQEARLGGLKQNLKGARYVVTGDVTEFGRKTIGDKQLFGILGRGKSQVAYAKVMLNVVDVSTSAILHSVQAAGEFDLSNREVLGFGGTAGYDSTLNGKVLDLAIREAVNKLVADLESKQWSI
ncbi:MAG: CsgG/HfaB family protein [Pseudobdellovibrionaceae bacterium]|nr:CsgG/HfaB family protein [Pseudobdellovibrionaceae bacterium]